MGERVAFVNQVGRSLNRVLLSGIMVVSGLLAALWVWSTIVNGIRYLTDYAIEVHGVSIAEANVPEFTQGLSAITQARYESVAVTVTDLPASARWLLWGEHSASALIIIGVCAVVIWLCARIWHQRTFGGSITGALVATALLVLICGLAKQIFAAVGRSRIVDFLGLESTAGMSLGDSQMQEGFMAYSLNLSVAPIGVAIALLLVAVAFRVGTRLQREVEGLV